MKLHLFPERSASTRCAVELDVVVVDVWPPAGCARVLDDGTESAAFESPLNVENTAKSNSSDTPTLAAVTTAPAASSRLAIVRSRSRTRMYPISPPTIPISASR